MENSSLPTLMGKILAPGLLSPDARPVNMFYVAKRDFADVVKVTTQ